MSFKLLLTGIGITFLPLTLWANPDDLSADSSEEGEGLHTVDYLTQIQPIFEEHCYRCHGPSEQRSGLRLDQRVALLDGGSSGAPGFVPGQIENSELLSRLRSEDKEYRMPYKKDALAEEEIALIETWIVEGANWPGQMDAVREVEETTLWSLQPVTKPAVPDNEQSHPIDAFLEAKLSEHSLSVNEPAEPEALIRRASIILTGLPASPERVQSFLQEWEQDSDAAYENLLDELFASQHFGERWAQHWLDVIRWAETTGYESNEFRKNAWPYRDYVVQAFNDDKPYDVFVKEQIAGDSLEEGVAMGFLVAGPHAPADTIGFQEVDIKQARLDRLDETIQTVTASMMGLTYGCARCHNHKFDPISIKDYYSMAAIFNDIEYDHRVPELPEDDPQHLAAEEIMAEVESVRAEFSASDDWSERWADHIKVQFPAIVTQSIRFHFEPVEKLTLDEIQLISSSDSSVNLTQQEGVVVTTSKTEEDISRLPSNLIDDRFERFWGWSHRAGDSESHPWVQIDLPEAAEISRADLSVDRLSFYGWKYMGKNGAVEKKRGKLPDALEWIEVLDQDGNWHTVMPKEAPDRSPEYLARVQRLEDLAARYLQEAPVPLFIGKLIKPTPMHVMHRGSPVDPRDEAVPKALEVGNGDLSLTSETSGPERRMAFADWLVDKENPLTSRVFMNRTWHHVFGTGIVSTTADLGVAGGAPSHPELLDWLASDFIDEGWSVKTMLRKMLTSSAFKRSSSPSEDWLHVDSDSRLLWRFPPRWLEAEVLRDSILQAAGSLAPTVGGEGYHIHSSKTRYAQWKVTDNYGPHTWRRMLYQQRMRRVDDQMFTAFDFPDCAQVQSKRTRSTTPLQALNLMNGNLILEQAGLLAKRARNEAGPDVEAQVSAMFWLALGRAPEEEELSVMTSLAHSTTLHAVARTVYNLNEFFYLN